MHRITSLATIILAIFRFLSWFSSDTEPIAETTRPVVTRVYNSSQQPSRDGTFDFTVTGVLKSTRIGYVNAVIDLDGDSSISAYQIEDGVQQEWVVRNVPVPMTDDVLSDPRFSVWFDMSDMNVPLSASKSCAIIVTEKPLSLELPKPLAELKGWEQSTIKITNSNWGTQESIGQAQENPRQGFSSRPGRTPPSAHAGNGARSFAVPDIAQRSNECGPTSAANTLIWLSHEHQFSAMLPRNADGSIDTSHLILDLMKSMSGTIHRPYRGLKGNQMVAGLRTYVQDKALPLVIRGGNDEDNARCENALDFIADHVSKNDGVDLLVWLADGGGHWVTITGFARAEGRAFLYVHDPDDKKIAQAVWELTLDNHGKSTGELTTPRSCTTAWSVSASMKSAIADKSTDNRSSLPSAVWLKSTPDQDPPESNYSAIEGTVSH